MMTFLILIGLFIWGYFIYEATIKAPMWILKHLEYLDQEISKEEFNFFKTNLSSNDISIQENKEEKEYQFFNEGKQ